MEYADWAAQVLAELRWNWGRAYEIEHDGGGLWSARRRDGRGERLTATGPGALRKVMFRDYTLDPVRRESMPVRAELRPGGRVSRQAARAADRPDRETRCDGRAGRRRR